MTIIRKNIILAFLAIILIAILILSRIFYLYDTSRITYGKTPVFVFPIMFYKDGGSVYKIGLGYGIFEWKILESKNVNGERIDGYLIGTELVRFPECYRLLFSHDHKPMINLKFGDGEGLN